MESRIQNLIKEKQQPKVRISATLDSEVVEIMDQVCEKQEISVSGFINLVLHHVLSEEINKKEGDI